MITIGEKLGHFLIRAEIGSGGMGTIYYAVDTMLNREVALKVVHPQLAGNLQLMERFKIEAMTQARLNHPNIVTIFSFNRIEDEYVIAMEYVEGRSLKDLLQEKKQLHPAEAVDIIAQVAEGLRYAHAHNVIHRDIKPANILIGRDGTVKISDFGIAKILGSQGLTKTGMLIGTPWYTSPEQIVGKDIDFRTDLYSLGVTFYEVLTGRVPFDSESNSEFQIQKAHLETPPPRPTIYNPEIGVKLERFILTALQKKVEKRFQSARDMIDELQRIHHELVKAGFSSISNATQKIIMPMARGRRFLLAPLKFLALLVLLLAGIALIVILLGKSGMDEGRGGNAGRPPAHGPGMGSPEAPGGAASGAGEQNGVPATPPAAPGASQQASMPAAGENQVPAGEDQAGKPVENPVIPKAAKTGPAGQAAAAGPEPGAIQQPRRIEPHNNPSTGKEPAGQAPVLQEKDLEAAKLGSLDVEMVRLRGFLEARNFVAADRLSEALIRSGAGNRALPMLGKVKFLLNQFAAAEKLWAKALEDNFLVSLEVVHEHGGANDFCLGQLKFKKKIVMFSSNTRGDHSFALMADGIRSFTLGVGMRIIITGLVDGQEISENFQVAHRGRRPEKEKFLVDFLNRYVL
jgi:hypothetical protein